MLRHVMKPPFLLALALLAATLATVSAPALAQKPPADPQARARQKLATDLPAALDRGRQWLISKQRSDGSFSDRPEDNCLIGLTLLEMGTPVKAPVMQRLLTYLLKLDRPQQTGFLALRTELLMRCLPQIQAPKAVTETRALMEKDLSAVLANQDESGQWRWQARAGGNMDSGYDACQALFYCFGGGMRIPETCLKKAAGFYATCQNSDGGWSFSGRKDTDGSDGNLTLRNMTSLMMIGRDQCDCDGKTAKIEQASRAAIESAIKHVGDRFRDHAKGNDDRDYWFYRDQYFAGRLLRAMPQSYFNGADLIRDYCQPLLARQKPNGSWQDMIVETAFCLYALAQPAKPVAVCEMVESDQQTFCNRGLLNFADYLSRTGPFLARYDRARLGLDFERYQSAPLIFIAINDKFKLADEEKKRLRDYVTRGGTVVAQIYCGTKESTDQARKELEAVWPGLALEPLLRNHPVWTADANLANRPPLLGLDDGVRTFAFVFAKNALCDLEQGDGGPQHLTYQLWRNILTYAREGHADFTWRVEDSAALAEKPDLKVGETKVVSIGLLMPAARKSAAAPLPYNSWPTVAGMIAAKAPAFRLLGPKPLAATDENLPLCDIVYLYGSGATSQIGGAAAAAGGAGQPPLQNVAGLTEAEVAGLKAYVEKGGFLFIEARLGDEQFDAAARKLAEALGLKMESAKGSPLLTGKFAAGAEGPAIEKVRLRKDGKLFDLDCDLQLLTLGGRLAGAYSPQDLLVSASGIPCYGLRGYAPSDARRLLINLLLSRTARSQP